MEKNNFIPRERFVAHYYNVKHEAVNMIDGKEVTSYLIGDNVTTFFISESDAIRSEKNQKTFFFNIKKSDTSKYSLRIKELDSNGKAKTKVDENGEIEYISTNKKLSGNELIKFLQDGNIKGITLNQDKKNFNKIKTFESLKK